MSDWKRKYFKQITFLTELFREVGGIIPIVLWLKDFCLNLPRFSTSATQQATLSRRFEAAAAAAVAEQWSGKYNRVNI